VHGLPARGVVPALPLPQSFIQCFKDRAAMYDRWCLECTVGVTAGRCIWLQLCVAVVYVAYMVQFTCLRGIHVVGRHGVV